MTSLNEIRQLFFVECEEQLEQLTDGLDAIDATGAEGAPDSETINTMFRAVHSIKGGAASFALDAITRFAHVFESVLDEVRGGSLAMSPDRLRVFYTASDYLSDLVALGATGEEPDPDALTAQMEAISAISATKSADGASPSADTGGKAQAAEQAADTDDLPESGDFLAAFTPTALDFGPMDEQAAPTVGPNQYSIRFTPSPALYANGHEPVHLFRELTSLGELAVEADLTDGQPWDAATPAIAWRMRLTSECDEMAIREIFEFAEPFAEIELQISEPTAGQETVEPQLETTPHQDNEPAPAAEEDAQSALNTVSDASQKAAETTAKPTGAGGGEAKAKMAAKATVRVDLDLVDDLINKVGELVITQSVMSQSISETGVAGDSRLSTTLEEFRALTRQIQEGIMAIRAQSVKPLFQRMARIVRETAQIAGKEVRFATEGEDTEIDRTVVERLVDPLTHILRNAIDHGLEHADRREAAGKSKAGTVTLSAAHRSGRVVIEVRDDGGGVNRDKVLASAINKGLVPENATLTPAEIDRLLFMPGFSTASEVTNLSGRGVGMDVVNNEIKRLGGRVSIASESGKGTVISISLPLTLAVLDGMIVNVAGQTMVVPISAIVETIRPEAEQLHRVGESGRMVTVRDVVIPVTDLGQIFSYSEQPALDRGGVLILVEDDHGQQRALAVDGIDDQCQVVIKSLESNYGQVPYVAAATILGDGKIALIVDIDEITFRKSAPSAPAHIMNGTAA